MPAERRHSTTSVEAWEASPAPRRRPLQAGNGALVAPTPFSSLLPRRDGGQAARGPGGRGAGARGRVVRSMSSDSNRSRRSRHGGPKARRRRNSATPKLGRLLVPRGPESEVSAAARPLRMFAVTGDFLGEAIEDVVASQSRLRERLRRQRRARECGGVLADFRLEREVGHGASGCVRVGVHVQSGTGVAVKSILKGLLPRPSQVLAELTALRGVKHPNFARFYEAREDARYLHLVSELLGGPDLFTHLTSLGELPEGRVTAVVKEVVMAVSACHNVGMVHGGVKPDNLLFCSEEAGASLKLCDCGPSLNHSAAKPPGPSDEAIVSGFGVPMTAVAGTPYYAAPEAFKGVVTSAGDMWSVGVLCYTLLCGHPPFFGGDEAATIASIQGAALNFSGPVWDTVSTPARDFVARLLVREPSKRLTAAQALRHTWLTTPHRSSVVEPDRTTAESGDEFSPARARLTTLRYFATACHLKRVTLGHVAATITDSELTALRHRLERLDQTGTGRAPFFRLAASVAATVLRGGTASGDATARVPQPATFDGTGASSGSTAEIVQHTAAPSVATSSESGSDCSVDNPARSRSVESVDALSNHASVDDLDFDGVARVMGLTAAAALLAVQQDVAGLLAGANGAGSVKYSEFLAATAARRSFLQRQRLRAAFDHFDPKGKGSISADSLAELIGASRAADALASRRTKKIGFSDFVAIMMRRERPGSASGAPGSRREATEVSALLDVIA